MNNQLAIYRKQFNNFKRTLEYKQLQSYLLKKQLYICVKCKSTISLNKDTHTAHLISLSDLVLVNRKDLINNYNNYYLMCNKCNLKQHNNTEFDILKEDILKLINIKELAKIIYLRKYKLNIKQLINNVSIN